MSVGIDVHAGFGMIMQWLNPVDCGIVKLKQRMLSMKQCTDREREKRVLISYA